MAANSVDGKLKNKISVGLILTKNEFHSNIIPTEVKYEIRETAYYLLIFISREDIVKISCFPTETNDIKKILIMLEEFSPDLVKNISRVFTELSLNKDILHTTGICYELDKCFYESYLVGDSFLSGRVSVGELQEIFLSLSKVKSVTIEDIPFGIN